MWCWRCKMEIPMLDEEEYTKASQLYREIFQRRKSGMTKEESFKSLLDYYQKITGFEETNPNAIMHHRIAQYEPICENCGNLIEPPKRHSV